MKVLVTGAAGFIGSALCQRLLDRRDFVIGVDNLNDYYDPTLKQARLNRLLGRDGFSFERRDISDNEAVKRLFETHRPDCVVNQAAQAGVRYSITHPHAYQEANLLGFLNILEASRHTNVKHLVYASSSSVYGGNQALPFSEKKGVDHPLSLYAATKRANELMAHSYSHLYGLPTTGLRYFTVYGPWGRPDMALFLFTQAILSGKPLDLFNYGRHRRDFTFIDDIIEGVVRILDKPAQTDTNWNALQPSPDRSSAPFRVYNIGNNSPVELEALINALEMALGKKAILNPLPLQPGDVFETCADVSEIERDFGFRPQTNIHDGVRQFVGWYLDYYGTKPKTSTQEEVSEAVSKEVSMTANPVSG